MTTNQTRPGSDSGNRPPETSDSTAPAPSAKPQTWFGKEQLDALRCELNEKSNHWSERMAATIDEDYRQLMKDFGFQ